MANQVVHKLIVQHLKEGELRDLVLCVRALALTEEHLPSTGIRFNININEVNCPDCKELWFNGIYR